MTAILILSPLILWAALGAVWRARPVHAALFLSFTLSTVAILFLTLGADFVGLVQFAVYVGAVAVLIVFSLLITRPADEAEEIARRPGSLRTGVLCALPVFVALGWVLCEVVVVEPPERPAHTLAEIGAELYTIYTPAVLALAVLLTAVLIGAALCARDGYQAGASQSASGGADSPIRPRPDDPRFPPQS